MSDTQLRDQLRDISLWCIDQRKGILTETGLPKKPPTYWIVDCPEHGMSLLDSTQVTYKSKDEGKMKCQKRVQNKTVITRKNWTSSQPLSVFCYKTVTLIEEIGETDDIQ